MRRTRLALLALAWLALIGCRSRDSNPEEGSREVIVFAAASLAEAFAQITYQFEQAHPDASVVLNLAGSQQLAHQLSQGAPADVFASANQEQMEAAIQTDRLRPGSQQVFAHNRLAVILPADNPADLRKLSDLARPGLQIVLAAPEVPAGRYAALLLDSAGADPGYGPVFRNGVLANVASYEENVRAARRPAASEVQDHAQRVVAPGGERGARQPRDVDLELPCLQRGGEANPTIVATTDGQERAAVDRHRHHRTPVVVQVRTHQVDAPWREELSHRPPGTEDGLEAAGMDI